MRISFSPGHGCAPIEEPTQNEQSDVNPGMQNPAPVTVNPGNTGIVRDAGGGVGTVAAGTPARASPRRRAEPRPGCCRVQWNGSSQGTISTQAAMQNNEKGTPTFTKSPKL